MTQAHARRRIAALPRILLVAAAIALVIGIVLADRPSARAIQTAGATPVAAVQEETDAGEDLPADAALHPDGGAAAEPETDAAGEEETAGDATVATLRYAPASAPRCVPVAGDALVVPHQGSLELACALDVQIEGTGVDPATARVDWSVTASVDGGWAVELQPPPGSSSQDVSMSETGEVASFAGAASLADNGLGEGSHDIATTETLAFGLRVHRLACSVDPQPVTLAVAVQPVVVGADSVLIEALAPAPEPLTITPDLAPIPEPSLAISGTLDFGEVPVDAFGVRQRPAAQPLTVTVSGLDRACGVWAVDLAATPLSSDGGAPLPESGLVIETIDGQPLPDGACRLDGGCRIAIVEAGPAMAAEATYTVGVSLVLPDWARADTFRSTLTARVTEAETSHSAGEDVP